MEITRPKITSSLSCEIELSSNSEEPDQPSLDQIQNWLASALKKLIEIQHPFPLQLKTLQVSVHLMDTDEGTELNLNYRKKNYATNVLSFPAESPTLDAELFLGDIAICAPVIHREAVKQNKLPEAHWAHIAVHGLLHLCGYDHIKETDAELMESLEISILNQLGFNNPYQTDYLQPTKPKEMINA